MNYNEESSRCLMCQEAPCTKACKKNLDPARGLMAIRFDNKHNAFRYFNRESCADCDAPCEKACIHYDIPIRIKDIALECTPEDEAVNAGANTKETASLEIDFCGVHCENPFFLASSVICNNYEMVARAFDMGWGGVVFKTIGLGEIKEVSPRFDEVHKEGTAFIGFRNMEQISEHPLEEDLDALRRLKQDYPTKIVVASIMGNTEEEWAKLARMVEDCGVDIIECNFSCPQMKAKGMGSDVGQNPDLVRSFTRAVKDVVKIPVLAKMTPNITHMEEPAAAAMEGGADGIAAINTIKSITVTHRSEVSQRKTISGYSGKAVKPIAQRFILDMQKDPRLTGVPMSGIGGIETWRDALEFIMLGCSNVQICTAVMQYGYRIIDDLKSGMLNILHRWNYTSLESFRSVAVGEFYPTDELDRDTYVMPHFDREKCIGCGRCAVSCADGGHQAIRFDLETRTPHLIGKNCVGCLLCSLICPTGAITEGKRIPKRG